MQTIRSSSSKMIPQKESNKSLQEWTTSQRDLRLTQTCYWMPTRPRSCISEHRRMYHHHHWQQPKYKVYVNSPVVHTWTVASSSFMTNLAWKQIHVGNGNWVWSGAHYWSPRADNCQTIPYQVEELLLRSMIPGNQPRGNTHPDASHPWLWARQQCVWSRLELLCDVCDLPCPSIRGISIYKARKHKQTRERTFSGTLASDRGGKSLQTFDATPQQKISPTI